MAYNQKMDQNMNEQLSNNEQAVQSADHQDRREVVRKLGKFAAYAAPFSVLALTQKASAASGKGPAKHK
ncbi:MAG TPA: hypothetical protein VK604_27620 [Bryobacteraceae bacterium]|nr:hypothetical protein [Bryobacteraceae bacterium]